MASRGEPGQLGHARVVHDGLVESEEWVLAYALGKQDPVAQRVTAPILRFDANCASGRQLDRTDVANPLAHALADRGAAGRAHDERYLVRGVRRDLDSELTVLVGSRAARVHAPTPNRMHDGVLRTPAARQHDAAREGSG